MSDVLDQAKWDLAAASRILAREGIMDAFGHASIRHPENPDRYIISRSRSPEIVSRSDLLEFTLDNDPVVPTSHHIFAERPIHGALYETRPDIMAVVHSHSHSVIPFGVTSVPLRQILHVAGGVSSPAPVWDIRKNFGDTNLLVTTRDQGLDLAAAIGDGNVALMRGHGSVAAGKTLKRAVHLAIYFETNARLLLSTLALSRDYEPLSEGEIKATAAMTEMPLVVERTWDYWLARADLSGI